MKKRLRRVLVRHTPWARSSDMMLRPWLSCSCGWNANRRELGNWNDHFMAAAQRVGKSKVAA